jgi:hypothetical protein
MASQKCRFSQALPGLQNNLTGGKTALFVHFLYKNHHFTKTGSGQT